VDIKRAGAVLAIHSDYLSQVPSGQYIWWANISLQEMAFERDWIRQVAAI
jgi:hypothetical protein